MSYDDKLADYVDVPTRIAEFRDKYPEGCLQPANLAKIFEIVEVAGGTFIAYTAAAYRTPDDPRPGIGAAWEPVPGRTPYTRNSELMNAETSAWGRAIIAVLAADSRKGIASQLEVRNRQAERESPEPQTDPAWLELVEKEITAAGSGEELEKVGGKIAAAVNGNQVSTVHREHLGHLYRQRQDELTGATA